ncbi:hypothetical protein FOPG_18681 [Fusarium oxysporum f. sp. conglutinans race 2 54008]|uniref:Uncharacterized protein n=2 Tax=Fusarium oxysporum TaxID=5507 RepID=A0A420M7I8_FUSOX|nr:hypothetical protein FOPG_18681 [Fusarium oxysporum f. sp. conglutinans race 2 54008]RKK55312.1 hypothetical protein BFJ69_g17715 [Fusarium oxysporum]
MQRLDPHKGTVDMSQEASEDGLLLRRCRDRLATHIESRTGVKVEPAEVRLTTKQSHAYTWMYTTEVAHLFSEDLENHETEAYQKLCIEVGRSFYAVSFTKSNLAGSQLRSGSPPPFCVPTFNVDAMESGEVTERVALLSHQLSMMETSAAYDAITRVQLQENIATLEYENERLAQEARQQREDAVYHRDFFYRLLEATDQLNLTIGDIHQDYIRTVNVSMFPKDDISSR